MYVEHPRKELNLDFQDDSARAHGGQPGHVPHFKQRWFSATRGRWMTQSGDALRLSVVDRCAYLSSAALLAVTLIAISIKAVVSPRLGQLAPSQIVPLNRRS